MLATPDGLGKILGFITGRDDTFALFLRLLCPSRKI
jgi:hypothetical protein